MANFREFWISLSNVPIFILFQSDYVLFFQSGVSRLSLQISTGSPAIEDVQMILLFQCGVSRLFFRTFSPSV